ncbi:MAG: hypothetical protein IPG50_23660 [Myxococcales bacterium]|nr:hypothetical protein [Myxococcales bacterium]
MRSTGSVAVAVVALVGACGSEGRSGITPSDGGVGDASVGTFVDGGGADAGRRCEPDALDQAGCPCTLGETRACYTSAAATRAVGTCKDGSQSCEGGGEFSRWSACVGAFAPTKEPCAAGVDLNCNGKVGCADPLCANDPICDTPCTDGETRACYGGAPGTDNVGACKAGRQTCIAGHWTKGCVGEVQPTGEAGHCKDGVDNDCNGVADCKDGACFFDIACLLGCTAGTTRDCYEGPAGTNGVASCHGGSQTCKPDGSGFGPCTGQVLPGTEAGQCADTADNDCDGYIDCQDSECTVLPACCVVNASPADGTLWANSPTVLYRIDPSTFAVTTVGSFNVGDPMTDIALTPGGVLHGISQSALYQINKSTGAATAIASAGGGNSLTFLANGKLLAAEAGGSVWSINPANGATTSNGAFGNDLKAAGDLVAVADGSMYGVSSTSAGGGDASSNNLLLRVNVATGAASVVGPIGHMNVWGLAYANAHVIGFTTEGKILNIDPATGAGTVLAQKSVEFWGATQSPLVDGNRCP